MVDINSIEKSLADALHSKVDLKATATAPSALVQLPATGSLAAGSPAAFLFVDREESDDGIRMVNAIAALALYLKESDHPAPLNFPDLFASINDFTHAIDVHVKEHLDTVMHNEDGKFQQLEANWRGLSDLAGSLTTDQVIIDFLDASKDDIGSDLANNELDIFGGDLFRKVYIEEYDSYGGRPFATMIGLYEFDSDGDVKWLSRMSSVCAAAHCPFVGSVGHDFFNQSSIQDVAALSDLDAVMNHPRMAKWNSLRNEDWAAYIGLTLPRYIVRGPWEGDPGAQGVDKRSDADKVSNTIGYTELSAQDQEVEPTRLGRFLWGNAALLFAQNVVRSYENSGWAQHIRGPIGGGLVDGMTAYMFTGADGNEELQPPVEIVIPDHREYQFARNGLIALVQKKNEAAATFFSATSIKAPKNYLEDLNTKNAYLVTNLSYTYSISIIAHYVKVNMREYIGSTADATYIQQSLSNWLGTFVTTVNNPDDLTLLYYPFKATSVAVEPKPGPFGWYSATISILPWQQFEGMDVELRLEAALGAKA